MPDVSKYLRDPDAMQADPEGHLLDLEPWSPAHAAELASGEGLDLGDEHLQVLAFLREQFAEAGPAKHARDLSEMLNEAFADQGGSKYLYRLFPKGPVAQGSRLAGLPAPDGAKDGSFGISF
ncbi:MAG: TusE/DsrC/DsvC family sulfur relay protein [Chromatiales bacterium]|nr:TusE/DsrC/DsvC family sulfur relay protein [Chromatiales bacterium]